MSDEKEKRTGAADQQRLDEQVHHAQKMEAIGQLAGGIAHDFNNLLTVICGYSDFVLGSLAPHHSLYEPLKAIRDAGDRAAALTRQLLMFSRKHVDEPKVVRLNDIVIDTEKMLRRLIGEDMQVKLLLDPAVGTVKADPAQLGQVLMNLAVNARDAMPTGGCLTIQTQVSRTAGAISAPAGPAQLAGAIVLSVSDTGVGMTPEVLTRIFEPFYTTKEVGKGTGLGLAVVHSIVAQCGGVIDVTSAPGAGSTFTIRLPECLEKQVERGPAFTLPVKGGTETILLVEDEEAVHRIVSTSLEAQGYRVLQAVDGHNALLLNSRHPAPIDLLITDVVMPKMSGRELAERLQPARPGLKVIYLSGYTQDAMLRHGVQEGIPFLAKPFSMEALARKVRDVLDK